MMGIFFDESFFVPCVPSPMSIPIFFTVIGVARNSKCDSLQETAQPRLYLPLFQNYYHESTLHVRVSGDPQSFAAAVAKTVRELNPDLPIFDVTTLKACTQVASFLGRIAGTMVGAFGLMALLLAAIGIYGVVAYATRQRTREIGIRLALGAQPGRVLQSVLRQGLRLTLAGLTFGLALSLSMTRFLRSRLFGVTTTDSATFACVAILLSLVALAACYIPARRAAKLNPVSALRYE